ncbi:hypothetical protein HRbin27_00951 [bacterium HR27]|nr:hypothetical protein HRbin27_00951 [bacterium HR27]
MGILGKGKQSPLVAERLEVGDELDVPLAAVAIDGADVIRGQRVAPGSDLGMTGERERMLDIKLKVVVLEVGEEIDELEERLASRHLAARDIEHDTAAGEHGPVDEGDGGKAPSVGPDELANGLTPVEQACRSIRSEDESLCPALDDIPFGTAGIETSNGRTQHENDTVDAVEWVERNADGKRETGYLTGRRLQLACCTLERLGRGRWQDELAIPIEKPGILGRARRDLTRWG